MTIKFGIDGTGPMLNSTYADAFSNSHVKKLCRSNDNYRRGPIGPGGGTMEAVDQGYHYVLKQRQKPWNKKEPIVLTGYSRGGLGALVIAQKLAKKGIPVQSLLLFDAVDRHIYLDAESIPSNVEYCLHVRRNPAARSRLSFGNCGTKYSKKTTYREQMFFCTHGAVGGTPWEPEGDQKMDDYIEEGLLEDVYNKDWNSSTNVTFAMDKLKAVEVWNYVMPFAICHGFLQQ